jgi:hypothetical protein
LKVPVALLKLVFSISYNKLVPPFTFSKIASPAAFVNFSCELNFISAFSIKFPDETTLNVTLYDLTTEISATQPDFTIDSSE